MIINHPLLGPRDSQEFTYLGDVKLMKRPNSMSKNSDKKFFDYLYLRNNPAGEHQELWYHTFGDHSWLVNTRNTVTHEIKRVELASILALKNRKKNE